MKIKLMIVLLTMLFLINIVSAQELPLILSTDKLVYFPGDTILIYADVYNINPYPVNVRLESLLTNEKGTYPTAIIPFEFRSEPQEKKKSILYNISVDENFISDKYGVDVVLFFNGVKIIKKSLEFVIGETLKEWEVNIKTCKDQACTEESKVFILNEDIYIDYDSEVAEPIITATLNLPDTTTQQLTLPTSIKAEQIGTYELDITASKQDYKTITKKEQFGVIETEAQIQIGGIDGEEGKDGDEIKEELNYILCALLVLAVIILIIIILIVIKYLRKKEIEPSPVEPSPVEPSPVELS